MNPGENAHTNMSFNAADTILNVTVSGQPRFAGNGSGNWAGDVVSQLVNAAQRDFRPLPTSPLATGGIGP